MTSMAQQHVYFGNLKTCKQMVPTTMGGSITKEEMIVAFDSKNINLLTTYSNRNTMIVSYCMHYLLSFLYVCSQRQRSIFYAGQWSTDGCKTSFTTNSTVCRCNHLTHFAILLSAQPLDLSQPQNLALQITGYIGVSISLVAMAATILVFVFLK